MKTQLYYIYSRISDGLSFFFNRCFLVVRLEDCLYLLRFSTSQSTRPVIFPLIYNLIFIWIKEGQYTFGDSSLLLTSSIETPFLFPVYPSLLSDITIAKGSWTEVGELSGWTGSEGIIKYYKVILGKEKKKFFFNEFNEIQPEIIKIGIILILLESLQGS